MQRALTWGLVLAMACLARPSAAGQQEGDERLAGVARVALSVDAVPDAVVQRGVTAAIVTRDVETALAAIPLPVDPTAAAALRVTINAVDIRTGGGSNRGVAFTVSVSLEQPATLTLSGLPARVTTWRRAAIGVASRAGAGAAIRAQLTEYLQVFATAWRAANPPAK